MIDGLIYTEDFISAQDQDSLIKEIDSRTWETSLKRRVQQYGYRYDYTKKSIDKSLYLGDLPDFLDVYVQKLTEYFKTKPDQVIINEYVPGQGISRHVDCVPCFGDTIISLSLVSPCVMEFETWKGDKASLLLSPRSCLILQREARYKWMHSIPARLEDKWKDSVVSRGRRVSLTFRKVLI